MRHVFDIIPLTTFMSESRDAGLPKRTFCMTNVDTISFLLEVGLVNKFSSFLRFTMCSENNFMILVALEISNPFNDV